MFSNLQKAKTFFYFKEDPRKEGVPQIEINQLSTPVHPTRDINNERPKLPHAKTTFALGQYNQKDNNNSNIISNLYTSVRLNSRPLTKTKSNLESRPFKVGPLQYINLVSKSELLPKEPRQFSFISYKSKSSNEIKKNNTQNENDNNGIGDFEVNDYETENVWDKLHSNQKEVNLIEFHDPKDKLEDKLEEKIEEIIKEVEKNIASDNDDDEEKRKKKKKDQEKQRKDYESKHKSLINSNSKKWMKKLGEHQNKGNHQGDSDSDNETLVRKNSAGEDWLLRWSILNNAKLKKHEDVFKRYDYLHRGHISGDPLVQAILSVHKLSNTKIDYLFNVLNLCEVDPFERGANLKMFKVITSLAEKINNLDDEWFYNLLPHLDIGSVENKAFKIRRLWSYLVNTKSKMLKNSDLMIEFEAGGVTKEHIEFARRKFSNNLYFEITDYITYIPLFLLIHDRIVTDPFGKYADI